MPATRLRPSYINDLLLDGLEVSVYYSCLNSIFLVINEVAYDAERR